jgi:ribosomal protein S18 acetylase RimI-like enzyme
VRIRYRSRFAVDDAALSRLQAGAFGYADTVFPWGARLAGRATITWIGAFAGTQLVGFAQARRTPSGFAQLFDVAVAPRHQRLGIGVHLVRRAVQDVRVAGFAGVLAEFEEHLADFYVRRCGFVAADATTATMPLNRSPQS